MLRAHQAGMTPLDAQAWQKSFDRRIRRLMREGADMDLIANARMPSEIQDVDYLTEQTLRGGWLDLQAVLQGLLYQAEGAIAALQRLQGLESKALALLQADPDDGLFMLFQALADESYGYSPTHALLCALVCELSARKLEVPEQERRVLFSAALVMNIGMARIQDSLVHQDSALIEAQRILIQEHPQKSVAILQSFGLEDEDLLDLVRWHHEEDESLGLARNLELRRILHTADGFVAKMAARKTRPALSPLRAARSTAIDAEGHSQRIGSAMASAIGFYPPGTYVQLANGETAVSLARGRRADRPQVLAIIRADGMPLGKYLYRDTSEAAFAITAPVSAGSIKVKVNAEKARKMRAERWA
jgi:HD-GYP domain-containing protein (c-di-GMP phosphodiesterase class II)